MSGSKFDDGCPYCGGILRHLEECPEYEERREYYGTCVLCRRAIRADDRVIMLDENSSMIHEDCADRSRNSLTAFLDLLGVSYCVDLAREAADE